ESDDDDDDDDKADEQQEEAFDFEGAEARVITYDASDDEDGEFVEDIGEGEPFEPDLKRPGQILVSLKSGPPYSHWNIRQLAKECGLRARNTHPFEIEAYPGYEHRRTLGFKEGLSKDENQEIRDKEPHVYTFVAKPKLDDEGDENAESVSATTGYASQSRGKRSLGVNSESFDGGPRLTVDEKRKRMMDIFHESQDVFLLKELEKIGPKQKGIVAQTVKDVVQSLVDDGMCHAEKIGSSNYFWSFPSEAAIKRRNKIADLEKDIGQIDTKIDALGSSIEKAQFGREQTDERAALTEELAEVEARWSSQQEELQQFKECDPELMNQRRKETVVAQDAANRWTDNIFIIQGWTRDKFNMETSQFNKAFGIPDDLDSV
ncbi:Meiotic nuclear division protein 1, partial [Linderina macrospora]